MTSDPGAETVEGRFAVRATAEANFAWLRTRLALESTLMAWVRTSISLIGFGFSIVEIFNRLGTQPGVAPALRPEMPRYVGMALIGAGVLGLLTSVAQYLWISRYLWSQQFRPIAGLREGPLQTPALIVAVGLTLIGILAFGAVAVRVP
jgi:putative membrane protein